MKRCSIFHIVTIIGILSACSDMNDMHNIYLENGETIYIGKVDSIHTFSGNQRVLVRFWITDPRAKQLRVYWGQRQDSLDVTIAKHNPLESQEFIIGENEKNIEEGDHTIQIYSYDQKGHRSIRFEKIIKIYGERYQQSLSNRLINKVVKKNNLLEITWGGSNNKEEIGVEICYTPLNGNEKTLFYSNDELSTPTIINDIDWNKPISYRSCYKPEETAIDTFFAPKTKIEY